MDITQEERIELEKVSRSQKAETRKVLRAKIILFLAQGIEEFEVPSKLNINIKTVRKWKTRYLEKRMGGLNDEGRSGAPPKITASQRCEIIAVACDEPKNYGYSETVWTYDMLTETANKIIPELNIGRTSIYLILENEDLKPNKFKMWLHSKDPNFREKVNEVVDLYLNSPKDSVIISVDEKTGMQAIERKYQTKMPIPKESGKYEYEYIRHGTQSLIAGFDVKTGKVVAECSKTRKAEDLIKFMEKLAKEYQNEKNIHIIWDNLNIHKDGVSNRWVEFNKKHGNRFHFHYTPIHASWVNQVEIFFSILQKKCLRYASFKSVKELKDRVIEFINNWNEKYGHPFKWVFKGYA